MTKNFKLRPKADEDLEAIYLYSIDRWGLDRTERYINDLEETFQKLGSGQITGRDASYIKPNLMFYSVVSHKAFYRSTGYGVLIVRVLHKSMDVRRHV